MPRPPRSPWQPTPPDKGQVVTRRSRRRRTSAWARRWKSLRDLHNSHSLALSRGLHLALIVFWLAFGLLLRGWNLATPPLWVDEAESAINALTILDHGVPVDHYLGQPLYENTLTLPNLTSAEYEFQDSSYSKRGVAVYHGWLPLYSIAASLRLAGIEPDRPTTKLEVRHSHAEILRRTWAARAPAVLFGGVFMLLMYAAGRALYGNDAGLAALTAAALMSPCVEAARQARYYSLTLALSAACVLALWRMYREGSWRDYVLGGVAFVLLFHTHLLSFATICVLGVGLLCGHLRTRPKLIRLSVFSAIVALGTLPWLWGVGFFEHASHLPSARSLLAFPQGYLSYFAVRRPVLFLSAGALVLPIVLYLFRSKLPRRFLSPLGEARGPLVLLLAWLVVGYLVFAGLVPAASYFSKRLTLSLLTPGILMLAVVCAACCRIATRRYAGLLAIALILLPLWGSRRLTWAVAADPAPRHPTYQVVEHLRKQSFSPTTRFYSTPNDHLLFTYLTGLPVQSVAPVYKTYLDKYPGPLVVLEPTTRYVFVEADKLWQLAQNAGLRWTPSEAERYRSLYSTWLLRRELQSRVAWVDPPPEPTPPFAADLITWQRQNTREHVQRTLRTEGNPVFDGFTLDDYSQWWPIFFYRFVNPLARQGERLNYADRLRSARAVVLPSSAVIYYCPPLAKR